MQQHPSTTEPRIQQALSELLAACGFARMSQDVLIEEDKTRLCRYARIVAKQYAAHERGAEIRRNFYLLGLL